MKKIRSFVRREGRITKAQKKSFETLFPKYGLSPKEGSVLNLNAVFDRAAPCILEIGFGMGGSLIEMAEQLPEFNFIGTEVYRPGIGALLHALERHELKNLRVLSADAKDVLMNVLPDGCLHRVQIFFPDPWPKRKHHKRRLIQTDFMKCVLQKLETNGFFHFATDSDDYAAHVRAVMQEFKKEFSPIDTLPRPLTKYERRAGRLGNVVQDLCFSKLPKASRKSDRLHRLGREEYTHDRLIVDPDRQCRLKYPDEFY